MPIDPEAAVSQQFLKIVYDLVTEADRPNIKGRFVRERLNLDYQAYLNIINGLQDAGYIHAPGGMASEITLTESGAQRVRRSGM